MAFKLTVNGVDKTSFVVQGAPHNPKLTLKQNERTQASFMLDPGYVPTYLDAVIIYDVDGTTAVFGGVVISCQTVGIEPGSTQFFTSVTCLDWMAYADWAFWTKTYSSTVTVKQVLTDMISDKLGAYGITLDGSQDNGDTLQPFSVTAKKCSDVLRDVCNACSPTRVVIISPAKAIRILTPGTLTAPWNISDATPFAQSFEWQHSTFTPANSVTLICGPSGTGTPTQQWTYTGSGAGNFPFEVDIQSVNGGWNQGYVTESVGPVNRTLSPPGGGGYYNFSPTGGTHGRGAITLGTGSAPSVGCVLTFIYTAQYPFSVTASSGATPHIEAVVQDPNQLLLAPAQAEAAGLLARLNQTPLRDVTYVTWKPGISPAQSQSVTLSARNFSGATLGISQVDAEFTEYTDKAGWWNAGVRLWQYTVQGTETLTYQGSFLDQARAIFGGGSSNVSLVSTGGGGGTVGGSGVAGQLAYWVSTSNIGGENQATPTQGGTGLDTHASTGVPSISSGTWSVNAMTNPQVLIAGTTGNIISSANLTFSGTTLTCNNTITTPAATNLVLSPTGDLRTDPTSKLVAPTTTFAVNLGSLSEMYAQIFAAELHVQSLVVQQTIVTMGGRVLVASGANTLASASGTGTTLSFKYNDINNGDVIVFEGPDTGGSYSTEFMHVTSAASGGGPYSYTVVRNYGGAFSTHTWPAGATCMNTGQAGSGFIDMYAINSLGGISASGVGPTLVGNIRNSATYNDWSPRWAVGNLHGLGTWGGYAYTADLYGCIFGSSTGTWITMETTNGLRMGNSSTVNIQIDTSGNCSLASGQVTIDTTGLHIVMNNVFSWSTPHAYWFSGTAWGGVNQVGLICYEYSGNIRDIYLENTTNVASKINRVYMLANGQNTGANFYVSNDETGGAGVPGPTGNINCTFQPTASDAADLGATTLSWRGLYMYSTAVGICFQTSGGATQAYINNDFSTRLKFNAGSANIFWDGTQFFPETDNARLCGTGPGAHGWSAVWSYAFSNASARELKQDIAPCSLGTSFLMSLKPCDYRYKNTHGTAELWPIRHGFIKDEVDVAYGGHCDGRGQQASGLDYTQMIAPLVTGFQDHERRIAALEAKK